MFRQKITDADRVLITVLHQRKLCTQVVLAELFKVCEATIRTAVRETRPLLHDHGYTPTPAPHRCRTADELLTFVKQTQTGHHNATDTPT